MTTGEQLTLTQLFLAGALTESVALFHQYGILTEIERNAEWSEHSSAPGRIRQFGVCGPEELFEFHRRTTGLSDWHISPADDGVSVINTVCKLHAITTLRGTASACTLCCITPLRALCGALPVPHELCVETTMQDADVCRFTLIPKLQGTVP